MFILRTKFEKIIFFLTQVIEYQIWSFYNNLPLNFDDNCHIHTHERPRLHIQTYRITAENRFLKLPQRVKKLQDLNIGNFLFDNNPFFTSGKGI